MLSQTRAVTPPAVPTDGNLTSSIGLINRLCCRSRGWINDNHHDYRIHDHFPERFSTGRSIREFNDHSWDSRLISSLSNSYSSIFLAKNRPVSIVFSAMPAGVST